MRYVGVFAGRRRQWALSIAIAIIVTTIYCGIVATLIRYQHIFSFTCCTPTAWLWCGVSSAATYFRCDCCCYICWESATAGTFIPPCCQFKQQLGRNSYTFVRFLTIVFYAFYCSPHFACLVSFSVVCMLVGGQFLTAGSCQTQKLLADFLIAVE